MFTEALIKCGFNCELAYNIALSNYKMKNLSKCLKQLAKIIENGVIEHPELKIASNA